MTPPEQERLKECPFCGGVNLLELGNMYEERFKFTCTKCKCIGPAYRTRAEATDGWNARFERLPESTVKTSTTGSFELGATASAQSVASPSVEGGASTSPQSEVLSPKSAQEWFEDMKSRPCVTENDLLVIIKQIQRESYLAGQKSSGEIVEKVKALAKRWRTNADVWERDYAYFASELETLLSQLESKGEV